MLTAIARKLMRYTTERSATLAPGERRAPRVNKNPRKPGYLMPYPFLLEALDRRDPGLAALVRVMWEKR